MFGLMQGLLAQVKRETGFFPIVHLGEFCPCRACKRFQALRDAVPFVMLPQRRPEPWHIPETPLWEEARTVLLRHARDGGREGALAILREFSAEKLVQVRTEYLPNLLVRLRDTMPTLPRLGYGEPAGGRFYLPDSGGASS